MSDYPITLQAGSHHNMAPGNGCAMEYVAVKWLMQHGWSWTEAWARMNDSPDCTDPLIRYAVQRVNDRLSDDDRQRMIPLLDRIQACSTPHDSMKARRVRVRVSCWAARGVLHLIADDERRAVALRSIETAEAWLRGEATEEDCRARADAAAAAAAYAAYAAADAAAAADADAAYAYAAAYAAYAALRSSEEHDLVKWLDELIDQWDKAVVEEGCAADEPPVPVPAHA